MAKQNANIGNMPALPYAVEEAINRLRINIGFLGEDIKKIMVVSSETDEGKSFVSMQLWNQMAKLGTPSIWVDCDLRKSVATDKYQISRIDGEKVLGTSSYLAGAVNLEDAILYTEHEESGLLPNVDNVVNPAMLLENRRFEEMLDTLAEEFRYVFVDAPPLGLVSDAERIGHLCDGAILVVRSGVTPKEAIHNSINQLERAGCPLLGIVLNRVDSSNAGYYRKRYGKYYGRYGKYGYGYGYYGDDAKKE